MRYLLILLIYSNFLFACNISSKIPIYYNSVKFYDDNNRRYVEISSLFSNDDRFLATPTDKGNNISVIFTDFEQDGFLLGLRLHIAGYIEVTNSSKRINFEVPTQEMSSWIDEATKQKSGIATNILDKIYLTIANEHCTEFQPFFDKINLSNQEKAQALVEGNTKEQKRRQALAKLAQEENYTKLKKVLKIKPEYRALLDDRTKTMLIGSYTLGEMSKSLRSGISDSQMIRKLQSTGFIYSSSFTYKQKGYLQKAGLSNKLIDFLELHTQEIEKQREYERRLARLERQREREIAQVQEARLQEKRNAQRRAKREEESSNNDMWGKIAAIGMGAVIANSSSLDSTAKAEFMTNYSTDVINNDMSMSNTKQWKDKTIQSSNTSYSNGTSEVDRNKKISIRCKKKSKSYNDGDGQSTSHCQHAIYNKCVADEMCTFYPAKCKALRSRVRISCDILSKMGDTQCPVCN